MLKAEHGSMNGWRLGFIIQLTDNYRGLAMKDMRNFGLGILLAASLSVHAEEATKGDYVSIQAPTALPYECGDFSVGYGPFDYTNYDHFTNKLEIVESAHFTREVEALIEGKSSFLLGDLDYTLKRFPNHHRALVSISKYEFQVEGAAQKLEKHIPIDCYFVNAMIFKPTDGIVRLVYGTYLHRKGMVERRKELLDMAQMQYNDALQLMPGSAEAHYNVGLFYYDINKLNLAVMHGHKAYELGFPLQGLKDKLKKKGVWDKTVSQN